MIVGQALTDRLTVVTADPAIAGLGSKVIW
jgi:hypothetical protein